jgi:hypothetical protein
VIQHEEIELHVKNTADLFKSPVILFNSMQLLDKDVEAYLLEKAGSFHRNADIRITLFAEEGAAGDKKEVVSSIHRYFSFSHELKKKQLKHTLNLGWRSLAIAFVFLLLMYSIANKLIPHLSQGGFTTPIRELFIILGWVALWRPAELLLFEWWPVRKNLRLFAKLFKSNIRIVSTDEMQ